MTFTEAVKESLRTGKPIKRKTQALYGLIINKLEGRHTVIAKYVNQQNTYPLDLADVMAEDWMIEGRE